MANSPISEESGVGVALEVALDRSVLLTSVTENFQAEHSRNT